MKIGLAVSGRASWRADQTDFGGLVGRIDRKSPDAVFLGGYPCPECGKLIAGLRGALPRVKIVGSDGFSDFEGIVKAAGKARKACT